MTLHLHRAPRTDRLADALGDLLARPLEDPFATELVLVPARGVERWLSQRLSHRLGRGDAEDGVCAGIEFRSPRSLVAELTGTVHDDPWSPDTLAWPLLEVIDESLDEPWCRTLARHLGHFDAGDEAEFRRGRRYAVARRLAGLFASYAVQRPQLLVDWLEGRATDGCGDRLDDDLAWQPPLWRALVDRVGAPPPHVRQAETVARLRRGVPDLPPRLSLFGHTRMPLTEIELLGALAQAHDVHVWIPHPSDVLWRTLAGESGPLPRRHDQSHRRVDHPLLATLGRDVRELQRSLGPIDVVDHHHGGEPARDTLLGWLQTDLASNAVRPAGRQLAATDRSVQVHSCHGPARQVDVLREVLLGLLADDPTLEPRDILVMCPDIETYAPLITAGFGLGDVLDGGHPAHRLRVRLADRALTQTNPLLGVAAQLLDLAGSRATASAVLDLAQAPPVRRRFGFTDDDLDTVTAWVRESGVRWGFDKEHRAPFGLDQFLQNTWQFGVDRVLAGVALSEDSQAWLGTTLPLDDVGSNRVELAGRLAELVERLTVATDGLTGTRPLAEWLAALGQGVSALTRVDPADQWQSGQVQREFATVLAEASAREDTPMRLTDVRALLGGHLAGRPTRANFRTGTLTVCTMVPMRSVPHRVVCLVGLDDGVFPRTSSADGDDVLARHPLTGERDLRSEDRQLFLDAILAARETLVVTYTGANEHTGAVRPPAVPLGELLDALDVTAAQPVRDHVLVKHPLQPFDVRNLVPGELACAEPFSFDRAALAGAKAAREPREPVGALVPGPLPARPVGDVALEDLQAFFAHPVRAFLRSRLDVSSPLEAEETRDAIPVSLEGLEKWQIGDRLLAAVLGGTDPAMSVRAERLRGVLPPGALGSRTLQEVEDQVRPLVVQANGLRQGAPRTLDVDVDLGGGRRLTGTVSSVFGNRIVTVTYSRLAAKHRLRSWIDLLALSAGHPDESWTAHALGRGRAGTTRALTGPLDHRAEAWLRDLVDIYDRGMREPLPLPSKTACAYAEASFTKRRGAHVDPVWKANKEWETDRFSPTGIPGEDADLAHVQVFGQAAPLEMLMTPPRPDESWNDEPHRLGQYAWRLWQPLLEGAENVGAL